MKRNGQLAGLSAILLASMIAGTTMGKYQLLKRLLPSLLPLIVFVVVDELYGTTAGLIVAICFGVAELLFTFVKDKSLDKFTLFDTALIVVLGSISYVLNNDIFFKLKPALVGAILCILLGISTFSKWNVFGLLSKRYLTGIDLTSEQIKQFNRSIRALFYIFSFHTLLVLCAAFFMSTEAWAFISTVVFYLLFAAYFGFEVLKSRFRFFKYRKEEWLPLVDEKGKVVGKAPRPVVHDHKEMLHPVVHLHIINGKQEVFLQKRPMTKLVEPGKWDMSVGGHIAVGEHVDAALKREAEEEIGIEVDGAKPVCQYVLRTDRESELVFLFYMNYEGKIRINPAEVEDGRFWNLPELDRHLGTGFFTPGFEIEFNLLKKCSIL